jgi:hypothetical protein
MRQRTLLITLAAIAIVAAAGIVIVLQPGEAAVQRQQRGFAVSFAAAENALAIFRATLATKDGPVAADALRQDMTVTIREVTAEKLHRVPADVRVDTPPRIGVTTSLNIVITLNSNAPNTTSPAEPAGPAVRILLICPEDDTANGCGD